MTASTKLVHDKVFLFFFHKNAFKKKSITIQKKLIALIYIDINELVYE